jgi:ABC-type multidrug transport system ATPase subunit
MDLLTRRYIWKLISDLKNVHKTSIILTSHSIEEAEALFDRIFIMIKGSISLHQYITKY